MATDCRVWVLLLCGTVCPIILKKEETSFAHWNCVGGTSEWGTFKKKLTFVLQITRNKTEFGIMKCFLSAVYLSNPMRLWCRSLFYKSF